MHDDRQNSDLLAAYSKLIAAASDLTVVYSAIRVGVEEAADAQNRVIFRLLAACDRLIDIPTETPDA